MKISKEISKKSLYKDVLEENSQFTDLIKIIYKLNS